MSTGQGSITFNQHQAPGGGGGAVTGAENGLTVVAGKVRLGGANPLTANTAIELSGFEFALNDTSDSYFIVNPTSGLYLLGDGSGVQGGTQIQIQDSIQRATLIAAGNEMLIADFQNDIYQLGTNDTHLSLTGGVTNTAQLTLLGSVYLQIQPFTGDYELGDVDGNQNGSVLIVNDGDSRLVFLTNAGRLLDLNENLGSYEIGGLATGNATSLQMFDLAQLATINTGGYAMLSLDYLNDDYRLGSAAPGRDQVALNGRTFLQFDGTNSLTNGIYSDNNNGEYRFGDFAGIINGTSIIINALADTLTISGELQGQTIVSTLLIVGGALDPMISTTNALFNNAGASVGTLTNSPVAGNPTKWIRINDAGTSRYIPTWS